LAGAKMVTGFHNRDTSVEKVFQFAAAASGK
jgi:hypothetical protein